MLYYPQKLSLSKPECSIRPTGRKGLFISGTFETVGENGLIDREIKAYMQYQNADLIGTQSYIFLMEM
jgi:hypothetical protein